MENTKFEQNNNLSNNNDIKRSIDLLKQVNIALNKNSLHENDLHIIAKLYATEIGTVTDSGKAIAFLQPFIDAQKAGILDTLLYNKELNLNNNQGNEHKKNNTTYLLQQTIPHGEIKKYTSSLSEANNRQNEMTNDLNRMIGIELPNSKIVLETAKNNQEYFDNQIKEIKNHLSIERRALNAGEEISLPIQNALSEGIHARRTKNATDNYYEQIKKKGSENVITSTLTESLQISPFDKIHGAGVDLKYLLQNIHKYYNTLKDSSTLQSSEGVFQLLKNGSYGDIKIGTPKSGETIFTKNATITVSSLQSDKKLPETHEIKNTLQGFINAFESGKPVSQLEACVNGLMPFMKIYLKSLNDFGKTIKSLFGNFGKLFDIIFGEGTLQERFKRANEIEIAELTLEESWAMNTGTNLWKKSSVHINNASKPLNEYALAMQDNFAECLFSESDSDLDSTLKKQDGSYKTLIDSLSEETPWEGKNKPNIMDALLSRHLNQVENIQLQSGEFTHAEKLAKIKPIVNKHISTIYTNIHRQERNQGNNPQESFAKAVLVSLISPEETSINKAVGVIKANKKTEILTDVEKNNDINDFKKGIIVKHQTNNMIKISPEPDNKNIKIKIDGNIKEYDKNTGLLITPYQKISILKTDLETEEKRGEIEVNIPLLEPKIINQEGKIVFEGLNKDENRKIKEHTVWIQNNDGNYPKIGTILPENTSKEIQLDGSKPIGLIKIQENQEIAQEFQIPNM